MPFLLIRNDITKVVADAIVNPANRDLLQGSGKNSRQIKKEQIQHIRAVSAPCFFGFEEGTKGCLYACCISAKPICTACAGSCVSSFSW